MAKIYVLMGKSATGKDTIYKLLLENNDLNLKEVITYTTRPIRENEKSGVEYHFSTIEQYEEYRDNNKVVESRCYDTIHGPWYYYMVNDGQIDLQSDNNYILIGTLESYAQIKQYYGKEIVIPIYIEIEDGERLTRALEREKQQNEPKYAEMCRRFLADASDFSEDNLCKNEIQKRYINNDLNSCVEEIVRNMHSRR
ncbi:MAG: guanylate kinase [Lachnospiraceae bacterium]|nr:guanylate kinase [Lachnospiraceae bacterium]